jgi:adenylate cyclase
MTAYRAGDWDKASTRFETCRKLNPEDALSATYIERCRILQQSPPPGEWDGVWVMAEK